MGRPPTMKCNQEKGHPTKTNAILIKKAVASHVKPEWGGVTRLSEEFGVSRKAVYQARDKGLELIDQGCEEEAEGHGKLYSVVKVDRRRLERAIISLYIETPNSIRGIINQLHVIYGIHVSFGFIQEVLIQANSQAQTFNESVGLSSITHCALDEMFSQGDPVMAGIDLDTRYLFLLEHSAGRSGDEWASVLERLKTNQRFDPDVVVKDAGTGLRDGVGRSFPNAQQRDDLFHALDRMNETRFFYERRALKLINEEWEAEKAVANAGKRGNKRALAQKYRRCRERADAVMKLHDEFDALCKQARLFLDFVDPDTGAILTGAECEAGLKHVADRMKALAGSRIRKTATYLKKRAKGLRLWIDELHVDLELVKETLTNQLVSDRSERPVLERIRAWFENKDPKQTIEEAVELACWFWKLRDSYLRHDNRWRKKERRPLIMGIFSKIRNMMGERSSELINAVFQAIAKRHRASSLVETLNSLLRPHLYLHKRVTQAFLHLFTAHRNLKKKGCGKVRQPSPYEILTGEEVHDWLTMIGYPPVIKN